jgi:hypothetical protein
VLTAADVKRKMQPHFPGSQINVVLKQKCITAVPDNKAIDPINEIICVYPAYVLLQEFDIRQARGRHMPWYPANVPQYVCVDNKKPTEPPEIKASTSFERRASVHL